jgi:ABC transport system ATP-binding/permease protein
VQLHEELARHATDHERVLELDTRLRAIGTAKDEAESAWLELAETAETR